MTKTPEDQLMDYVFANQGETGTIVFAWGDPGTVIIEELWSDKERGVGNGSKLLRLLVDAADQFGVTLSLRPASLEYERAHLGRDLTPLMHELNKQTLTTEQLRDWYGRYGFEPAMDYDGSLTIMKRPPAPAYTPGM